MKSHKKIEKYQGFEQGPIRPPSEAGSLLIRVTRNCPWNRCTFCPVYKGSDFSLRPLEHVLADIESVHRYVVAIQQQATGPIGGFNSDHIKYLRTRFHDGDPIAMNAALHWVANGMHSIFLQDANSLIIKPENLLAILRRVKEVFPWVTRVTSYARSHTVARIGDEFLLKFREAGLTRIHIGMESGSDKVLSLVHKGVDKNTHILAGQKIKKAGIELSEYVMPGLGGRDLSREHAIESADALNRINPDFIRLRSLAIPNHVELYHHYQDGSFVKLTDIEIAEEMKLFLEGLNGINSTVTSDHILNLFEDLQGQYPKDKEKMIKIVKDFLGLSLDDRIVYQVGRRLGLFRGLNDMNNPIKRRHAENARIAAGINKENVDQSIEELMKRFI